MSTTNYVFITITVGYNLKSRENIWNISTVKLKKTFYEKK